MQRAVRKVQFLNWNPFCARLPISLWSRYKKAHLKSLPVSTAQPFPVFPKPSQHLHINSISAMDTSLLCNNDPNPPVSTPDEKQPLLPFSAPPSSTSSPHPSQFPSYHDWYQYIVDLDYETFCSLRHRPPPIQTPYSDLTDQAEFAASYRLLIFCIYMLGIPFALFITSSVAKLFFKAMTVAWGCFLIGLSVILLGWAFFALAGKFEVDDFLNLHTTYFLWPLVLVFLGGFMMKEGSGNDFDVGVTIFILGATILLANVVAYLLSRRRLEKRTEIWPPLDDVKFIVWSISCREVVQGQRPASVKKLFFVHIDLSACKQCFCLPLPRQYMSVENTRHWTEVSLALCQLAQSFSSV